jgi:hypothetical protein
MASNKTLNKNLDSINSKYVDINNNSPIYLNITSMPKVFTSGINIFRFKPTVNVSTKHPILVEVIDKAKRPVVCQILSYKEIDGTRIVSIEINNQVPSGDCIITMIATVLKTKGLVTIPNRFIQENNYKYNHKLLVDNTLYNDTDIIYTISPKATMQERIFPMVEEKFTGQKNIKIEGIGIYTNADSKPRLTAINGNSFPKNVKNGTISFPNLSEKKTPKIKFVPINFEYSSSISNIKTPLELELSKEVYAKGSAGQKVKISKLYDQPYYIDFYVDASAKNITQNLKTYAVLDIENLKPTTGDVSKIKVSAKSSSKPKSEYELLYDGEVEPRNVLVDTNSQLIDNELGNFDTTITVNVFGTNQSASFSPLMYWQAVSSEGTSPATPVTYSGYSFNAISFQPDYVIQEPQYVLLQQHPQYSTSYYKDTKYTLKLDYFIEDNKYDFRSPMLEVYVSGSAFVNNTTIGKFIGKIPSDNNQIRLKSNFTVPITPDNNGKAILRFKITDGVKLSNIRVLENVDIGFTPNRTRLYVPIKQEHKNEYFDFKVDFVNNTDRQANISLKLNNILFKGGNVYLFGSNNLISGSMFLASKTGSGINLDSNLQGSAIKSNNYSGLEYSKLNKTSFGWGLSYGNPHNESTYYANSRIDMINQHGSSFVFVSETGSGAPTSSNTFNLYLVGPNSSLLIGSSQSITGFGEGAVSALTSCGNSYVKWDGCSITMEGIQDSNGTPYITTTRLEDYTELKRSGYRFSDIPTKTDFVSTVLTMPTGSLANMDSSSNSIIQGATPALKALTGSMFYDTKQNLPLIWTGNAWESLIPIDFRTSVFNHGFHDNVGGTQFKRHKHNKNHYYPVAQLISEYDNIEDRTKRSILNTGAFPGILNQQSIILSPYDANNLAIVYLGGATPATYCQCYELIYDQKDDIADEYTVYDHRSAPEIASWGMSSSVYPFDGNNEFGYIVPSHSASADNALKISNAEEEINPFTGRNIYTETMEICSASWALSESYWMNKFDPDDDGLMWAQRWMYNSHTLVIKI